MDEKPLDESMRPIGVFRTVVYSMAPLLLVVALVEGSARLYEWIAPGDVSAIDLSFGFDPSLHVFPPSTDEQAGRLQRFRRESGTLEEGTFLIEKPGDTFRVFMLGGSSVAFLQNHFEALEEDLNRHFDGQPRIELINAGMWSYGSQRVMLIAREVIDYDPDLLVLYSGHNEFEDLRQLQIVEHMSPLQRLLTWSAIYRIYWHRSRARQLEILKNERNMALLKEGPFPDRESWAQTFSHDDLSERMQSYRQNLSTIAQLCRDRGVPLLIGTVPSNYWQPALEADGLEPFSQELVPLREAGKYDAYNDKMDLFLASHLRRQSSSAENAVIRDVAAEYDLPVADVLRAVMDAEPHGVAGETLFTDSCHLNDQGNDVWIATFEPLIVKEVERASGRSTEKR